MSAKVFTLPDLGEGLAEAVLVRWLVEAGEVIAVDAPVAEVETAKATVEVPSPFAGTVAQLHGEEGQTIPVGAPLVTVASGDRNGTAGVVDPAAAAYVEEERAGSGNVLVGYGTAEVTRRGRRRRRGAALGADTAPPARPAAPQRPRIASPIVRQLARRAGLEPAALTGTGTDGLVTRADVERAVADRVAGPAPSPVAAEPSPAREGATEAAAASPATDRRTGLPVLARVPLRGVRAATARTLARSRQEIPEATTWVDVDATTLLELREELRDGERAPGLLAMVARFVVAGLRRFPELNSRVDAERDEIVQLDGVNLGIAAQTPHGLVVPSIRAAHNRGIRSLDAEIRRLATAARDGTLGAAELASGSFTLNNYGVFGVDGSAAIINHPEAAILGIGRVLPRPWVVDGEVVPRQITQLSLVFDHRVCDGGTAGGFLRFVADAIERPLAALAEL